MWILKGEVLNRNHYKTNNRQTNTYTSLSDEEKRYGHTSPNNNNMIRIGIYRFWIKEATYTNLVR